MRQFRWTGAIVFLLCSTSFSATTTFDANAVIQDGDVYDVVVVKGDNTTVNITGGEMNRLFLLNSCTVNMSGGVVLGANHNIICYDNAILNFGSGQFPPNTIIISAFNSSEVTVSQTDGRIDIYAYDQSSIELIGGSVNVNAYGSSVVDVSGQPSINMLSIHETATLNILSDAAFGPIQGGGSGIINLYNGSVQNIQIYRGNCTVNLNGGEVLGGIHIDCIEDDGEVRNNPIVNVFGTNLIAVPYGGSTGFGQVSGEWEDQTPFLIDLSRICTFSSVVLHEGGVAPPICEANLQGDINLDCQVNLLDFAYIQSEWLDCGLSPVAACSP